MDTKNNASRNETGKLNNKQKEKNANAKMGKVFKIVTIVFLAAMAFLAVRLIVIHVFDGEKYTKAALNQSSSSNETITAKRGDITDRNGIRLATSARVYNLILDPKLILTKAETYQAPTVALIEKCFQIPADDLNKSIAENPDSHYVVLRRNLAYKDVEEFMKLSENDENIKGIWLEDHFKRTYPCGTLACSVLGFTEEGGAQYGIEASYNDELQGSEGRQYTYVNAENVLETVRKDPVDGYSVETTIDYNIQSIVEKHIQETLVETNAKNVAVLIMNPNNGEIYAMADSNTFDPNKPRDLSEYYSEEQIQAMTDEETTNNLSTRWTNYCVTNSYEPGSTFKPFTLAGALSLGTTKMNDEFFCMGSLTFYDVDVVHCHLRDGHGTLDTKGVMAQSCNVGLMTIADKMGKEEFVKMQTRFGFGHLTGIDLPNERDCSTLVQNINNMTAIDLATNAFGQNFSVTMIQMGSAFSSLVNGGYYYQPYVVKNIYNADGALVKSNEKTLVSTTVSNDVAKDVKDCMRAVVTEGTGTAAAVTGYKIAGKTGTAEKYDAQVQVTEDDKFLKKDDIYLTSFIGFAPFENPEIVCYAVVDEADKGEDSTFASILFSRIMTEVLPYLNIEPDGDSTDEASWDYYVEEGSEDGAEYEEGSDEEQNEDGQVSEEENAEGSGEEEQAEEYAEEYVEEYNGEEVYQEEY